MKILSIETSCDETGLALVEASGGLYAPTFTVLKNLVSSQIKIHRPFGGVVPSLAKREHLKNLPLLYQKIFGKGQAAYNKEHIAYGRKKITELKTTRYKPYAISHMPDLIAVTVGPGLEPALWTGIEFARNLYKKLKTENSKLRLIGTNHLEGHLYSFLLSEKTANPKSKILNSKRKNLGFRTSKLEFPAITLLVSGGHTILLKMDSLTKWKKLGETRDDAAGEAFDKVARMLNLPYPGGPEIERFGEKGNPAAIAFPRPMIHTKDYEFSFSGLKTSVLYYLRNHSFDKLGANKISKADVAASFQQAIVDVLVSKTMKAAREFGAPSIILCGGVAANNSLRKRLKAECDRSHVTFYLPRDEYNTDNAAMIAAAGYFGYLKKKKLPLAANGDLEI